MGASVLALAGGCAFPAAPLLESPACLPRNFEQAWLAGRQSGDVPRFCYAASGVPDDRRCFAFLPTARKFHRLADATDLPPAWDDRVQRGDVELNTESGSHAITLHYASVAEQETDAAALPVSVRSLPGRDLVWEYSIPLASVFASPITMLKNSLFVRNCVGAGPGCEGLLIEAVSGRVLAKIDANLYGGDVLRLDDARFAFASGDGGTLLWIDVDRGRVLRRLALNASDVDTGAGLMRAPCANATGESCIYIVTGGSRAGELRSFHTESGRPSGAFTLPSCGP